MIAQMLLDGFTAADASQDGLLSLDEAQTVVPALTETEFNELDTDNDGLLSTEELEAVADTAGGCALFGKSLHPAIVKQYISDIFLMGMMMLTLVGMTRLEGRRDR